MRNRAKMRLHSLFLPHLPPHTSCHCTHTHTHCGVQETEQSLYCCNDGSQRHWKRNIDFLPDYSWLLNAGIHSLSHAHKHKSFQRIVPHPARVVTSNLPSSVQRRRAERSHAGQRSTGLELISFLNQKERWSPFIDISICFICHQPRPLDPQMKTIISPCGSAMWLEKSHPADHFTSFFPFFALLRQVRCWHNPNTEEILCSWEFLITKQSMCAEILQESKHLGSSQKKIILIWGHFCLFCQLFFRDLFTYLLVVRGP